MRIWIDILTPKQVLFFKPLEEELKRRGHKVLCTSRRYREVGPLSAMVGFKLKIIGRHGGGSLSGKLKASCERSLELADVAAEWMPEVAVSFSSPECARVAFGLGVNHICISDSPHSEKVCRLTLPLSELLITPWIVPVEAWAKYGVRSERILQYRALDPAAWLKRRPRKEVRKEAFGLDPSKKMITIRLEESQASYLMAADRSYSREFLDQIVVRFTGLNIYISGRYSAQITSVKKRYGSKVTASGEVVEGASLASASDVFIGMGGTMTVEAALLGVPTLSAFQGPPLYTEEYLIREGLLAKPSSIDGIVKTVENMLSDGERRSLLEAKAHILLDQMEDPIKTITETVEARKV